MDRNMALEMVRVTEAAALASAASWGAGTATPRTRPPPEAMRQALADLHVTGGS